MADEKKATKKAASSSKSSEPEVVTDQVPEPEPEAEAPLESHADLLRRRNALREEHTRAMQRGDRALAEDLQPKIAALTDQARRARSQVKGE